MDDPILSDPPSFNLSLKKLALIVDPFSAESTLIRLKNPAAEKESCSETI
jgi:hypothetical protein